MDPLSLLIVDDETGVRESLRLVFDRTFRLGEASSGADALLKFKDEKPDIVLLDILMSGGDGLQVLRKIKALHPECVVIMLTALNTARTAFMARESGAFDYVTKPFDVRELRRRVDLAIEKIRLSREADRLKEEVGRKYGVEDIVGKSRAMCEVFRAVSMVAGKKSTVLITGESGTGKDLIARAVHYNSDRRGGPFVIVNCAALPEALIESELFGYERGAFTNAYQRKVGYFELADGGTLFLDEIGEMSLPTQAKLLRAIENETFSRLGGTGENKVDVRVLASSNRDLEKLSRTGSFRADLFYRLAVVHLRLPALRERKEDIPLLADHFLRRKARENSVPPKILSAEAVECLTSYAWPGNIRELENLLERLTVLSPHEWIAFQDLPESIRRKDLVSGVKQEAVAGLLPLRDAVAGFERELILHALQKTGFNQTRAASLLRTSRRILRYRMEKLRIQEESGRATRHKGSTDQPDAS